LVVLEASKRLGFDLFTFGIPLIPHICVLVSLKLRTIAKIITWLGPLLVSILLYGNYVIYTELLEVRAQDVLIFPVVAFWQFIAIVVVVVSVSIFNKIKELRHNNSIQNRSLI
jgi:hypothetical protein